MGSQGVLVVINHASHLCDPGSTLASRPHMYMYVCWVSVYLNHNRLSVNKIQANTSDEGLTLETSAFRISVRWPIYIINSVDKTKFLYTLERDTLWYLSLSLYILIKNE